MVDQYFTDNYNRLFKLGVSILRRFDHTKSGMFDAAELVNSAWLQLSHSNAAENAAGEENPDSYLFRCCARSMHQYLWKAYRNASALKRGGATKRVGLDDIGKRGQTLARSRTAAGVWDIEPACGRQLAYGKCRRIEPVDLKDYLANCDEASRQVMGRRLAGYRNTDIVEETGIPLRSVERIISRERKVIRQFIL